MFLKPHVDRHIMEAIQHASDMERAHLVVVQQSLDGREQVVSGVKPLNRYSIQQGKTFATSTKDRVKYKVLRVLADDVVLQDLSTQKVFTVQVDKLLKEWSEKGIKEISLLDDIIQTVKNVLGPVLGIFLTTALIAWLTEKLR